MINGTWMGGNWILDKGAYLALQCSNYFCICILILSYKWISTYMNLQLCMKLQEAAVHAYPTYFCHILEIKLLMIHMCISLTIFSRIHSTGQILGLPPANERRRYFVITSLIGWAQALNQPWYHMICVYINIYIYIMLHCMQHLLSLILSNFIMSTFCWLSLKFITITFY